MKLAQYIPDHAATTLPILLLLLLLHLYFTRDDGSDIGIELTAAPLNYFQPNLNRPMLDIDAEIARLKIGDVNREREIRELLEQGDYKLARTRLLELAASAVTLDDKNQLGDTLLLLGEVAIHQQELGDAEIYLQEALYLMMSQKNLLGTARVYQQLGHLNIQARALARQASNTYDRLWQARNLMARGIYQGVGENLQEVIEESLRIRRFGAAADAWESLASFHGQLHDDYQAQQANIEAARLYASTGQMAKSRKLLAALDKSQIDVGTLQQLNVEIDELFDKHQQDEAQTWRARDYEMLFHHYQRNGEIARAWEFRIKASESLAKTTDRSLFQRQADVIAVLYNSNFAMDRARRYLDQAGAIYGDRELSEMRDKTLEMESMIF